MLSRELDYELPDQLIAQKPLPMREASRLLVLDRNAASIRHDSFTSLPSLLAPALFVFNDTRVIPARLRGEKPTGGKFELLLIERLSAPGEVETWVCMAKPLKSLKVGTSVQLGTLGVKFGERRDATTMLVTLEAREGVSAALAACGELPLPPYITRSAESEDQTRYQTVFAREPGAVAAPTAGLHFSEATLAALKAQGHECAFVTLHVGPGTFLPLTVEDLRDHVMHEERYFVPEATARALARAKAAGRPVVAVGTTVMRTLESAVRSDATIASGSGSTRLCIYPPYHFAVVDALVTNFHLPRSTLLALVMAFAGTELTRRAYREAVSERYRFFSYGDATLVRP
jgi:S-adenosylmethionine:tRNA ribosyltransferase-isomerase